MDLLAVDCNNNPPSFDAVERSTGLSAHQGIEVSSRPCWNTRWLRWREDPDDDDNEFGFGSPSDSDKDESKSKDEDKNALWERHGKSDIPSGKKVAEPVVSLYEMLRRTATTRMDGRTRTVDLGIYVAGAAPPVAMPFGPEMHMHLWFDESPPQPERPSLTLSHVQAAIGAAYRHMVFEEKWGSFYQDGDKNVALSTAIDQFLSWRRYVCERALRKQAPQLSTVSHDIDCIDAHVRRFAKQGHLLPPLTPPRALAIALPSLSE